MVKVTQSGMNRCSSMSSTVMQNSIFITSVVSEKNATVFFFLLLWTLNRPDTHLSCKSIIRYWSYMCTVEVCKRRQYFECTCKNADGCEGRLLTSLEMTNGHSNITGNDQKVDVELFPSCVYSLSRTLTASPFTLHMSKESKCLNANL